MKIQTQNIEAETAAVRVGRLEIRPTNEPVSPTIGYGHTVWLDGVEVKEVTSITLNLKAGELVTATMEVWA